MKEFKLKIGLIKWFFLLPLLTIISCTDLEPVFEDTVLQEDELGNFSGIPNPKDFLEQTLYSGKMGEFGDQANTYAMQTVASDESVVVTRGADWGDNGVWRNLHQHNWRTDHPFLLRAWNRRNQAVFLCTQLMAPATSTTDAIKAQAQALRALNMFFVMDMFGQVPFREVDEGIDVNPRVFSRTEAFDFIVKDLMEALPNLPEAGTGADSNIANKGWAYFLLAKLYLNKEIYTGSADASDFTKVVENVDALTNAGYSVNEDYFSIFKPKEENQELIATVNTWTGNRVWNVLHPNQGGWNGFATLAEVYDSFEDEDIRRGVPSSPEVGFGSGLLIGQQYDAEGNKLTDRQGADLVFTKDFPGGLLRNNERTGVRLFKYSNTGDDGNPAPANNYVLMRYSDAVLMKAEAIMRGGSSSETAVQILDNHRTIRGAAALGSYSMEDISNERRRELYAEGWRRNDQVRFGNFSSTWDMKDNTEDFRVLYPIPLNAVATNPNLVQNPGY